MKRAPRSRQRHDLYAKYHDYDSEISDLLGECGVNPLNPKYAMMVATWKRLPLPVANLMGPWIARGLG